MYHSLRLEQPENPGSVQEHFSDSQIIRFSLEGVRSDTAAENTATHSTHSQPSAGASPLPRQLIPAGLSGKTMAGNLEFFLFHP